MIVERSESHPFRPQNYKSAEPVWEFGYEKIPGLKIDIPWDMIDSKKLEMNTLGVWTKKVN